MCLISLLVLVLLRVSLREGRPHMGRKPIVLNDRVCEPVPHFADRGPKERHLLCVTCCDDCMNFGIFIVRVGWDVVLTSFVQSAILA